MINALVVEDERDIRELLALELGSRGYEVREAQNGEVAIQRVNEQKPDIIFEDIMMPVMDGIQLITWLKNNPRTAQIPIVIVTALKPHETKGTPRHFGIEYLLTKPWEPWALESILRRVFGPAAVVARV